jgi:hypothetical protein
MSADGSSKSCSDLPIAVFLRHPFEAANNTCCSRTGKKEVVIVHGLPNPARTPWMQSDAIFCCHKAMVQAPQRLVVSSDNALNLPVP